MVVIGCPDELGRAVYNGRLMPMQNAIDLAYVELRSTYPHFQYIWDLNTAKRWGKKPASDKQVSLINRRCKGFKADNLTKLEASMILNRLFAERKAI
jgi:hypothetical protein